MNFTGLQHTFYSLTVKQLNEQLWQRRTVCERVVHTDQVEGAQISDPINNTWRPSLIPRESNFRTTATFKMQTKTSHLTQLATFPTNLGQRLEAWMTSSPDFNLYEAVKTWIQLLCQHTSGTCTCSPLDKVV